MVIVVTVVGILAILDMIASLNLQSVLFSPWLIVPLFLGAYAFAPFVERLLPYSRGGSDRDR